MFNPSRIANLIRRASHNAACIAAFDNKCLATSLKTSRFFGLQAHGSYVAWRATFGAGS